jgi:hypothetical protein
MMDDGNKIKMDCRIYPFVVASGHQVTSPPSSSRRRADTVTEIKKIEELPYPPSKQQPQPTPPTSQLAPHHHTERFLFSV